MTWLRANGAQQGNPSPALWPQNPNDEGWNAHSPVGAGQTPTHPQQWPAGSEYGKMEHLPHAPDGIDELHPLGQNTPNWRRHSKYPLLERDNVAPSWGRIWAILRCKTCHRVLHRDLNAALNMGIIAHSILAGRGRPKPFCKLVYP